MRRGRSLFLILAVVFLGSCTKAINYTDPSGPRYAGGTICPAAGEGLSELRVPADPAPSLMIGDHAGLAKEADPREVRIATFNIKFARHIDRAIELLTTDPALVGADLLFLQEMDEPGTRRVAEALRMNYVYYPSTVHPLSGRDFGNALLSRWPIAGDRKINLPHLARFNGTLRNAVAGTVIIRGEPIRLYCVHLATPWGLGPDERRDQVRTILEDAERAPGRVVIAGDLNGHAIGRMIEEAGFRWPTKDLGATVSLFDVDHVFLRGFDASVPLEAGVVRENRDASDHKPVWIAVRGIDRSVRVSTPETGGGREPVSAFSGRRPA